MKVYKSLSIALTICILMPFTVGCSSFRSIKSTIHYLGIIKDDIKSKETKNSVIGFRLKKGDKVKFTYNSIIKEGTIKIELIGSEHKEPQCFLVNKSGTKEFVV